MNPITITTTKAAELVLSTLKNFEEEEEEAGCSIKQICNFISETQNYSNEVVKKAVEKALRAGVSFGVITRVKRGYYALTKFEGFIKRKYVKHKEHDVEQEQKKSETRTKEVYRRVDKNIKQSRHQKHRGKHANSKDDVKCERCKHKHKEIDRRTKYRHCDKHRAHGNEKSRHSLYKKRTKLNEKKKVRSGAKTHHTKSSERTPKMGENSHTRSGKNNHSKSGEDKHSRPGKDKHSRQGKENHSRSGEVAHSRPGEAAHSRSGEVAHSRSGEGVPSRSDEGEHSKSGEGRRSRSGEDKHSRSGEDKHSRSGEDKHSRSSEGKHSRLCSGIRSRSSENLRSGEDHELRSDEENQSRSDEENQSRSDENNLADIEMIYPRSNANSKNYPTDCDVDEYEDNEGMIL